MTTTLRFLVPLIAAVITMPVLLQAAGLEPSAKDTYTVDTLEDVDDKSAGDGECSATTKREGDRCSLKAAIQEANARQGRQKITFGLPGDRLFLPELPPITGPVIIDGINEQRGSTIKFDTVKPGPVSAGVHSVTLVGQHKGFTGLRLMASDSIIRHLGFTAYDVAIEVAGSNNLIEGNSIGEGRAADVRVGIYVSGSGNTIGGKRRNIIRNGKTAIHVGGTGARNNHIVGNELGPGNEVAIHIDGAADNIVGGEQAHEPNLIFGASSAGVRLANRASGNKVIGNLFGTYERSNDNPKLGNVRAVEIVDAPDNLVGGRTQKARNIIVGTGSESFGVLIRGERARGNRVEGNWFGLYPDARRGPALAYAVQIENASDNVVGGDAEGAGNVIAGCSRDGIRILGPTASGNRIEGNLIGTDPDGRVTIGNGGNVCYGYGGIRITNASANIVGGRRRVSEGERGPRNVISGNGCYGVMIEGEKTTGNRIAGNYIGPDQSGRQALVNGTEGVIIKGGFANVVGGDGREWRNVISGNGRSGVFITGGASAVENVVQGNLIGLDAYGKNGIPNFEYGVRITDAPRTRILGNAIAAFGANPCKTFLQQCVKADRRELLGVEDRGRFTAGIYIEGTLSSEASIQGNTIGLNEEGSAAVPGWGDGVHMRASKGHRIGGTERGADNRIGHSFRYGVLVASSAAAEILGNAIFASDQLGIRLDTGGNAERPAPLLETAQTGGHGTVVRGSLKSAKSARVRVELFANRQCHQSGAGEGERFVATTDVQTDASGAGRFEVAVELPRDWVARFPTEAQYLTATASDRAADDRQPRTSPFSRCLRVKP